jgi:peptidoglycan hydrolase-like protein with peptidoglycan-binding domain
VISIGGLFSGDNLNLVVHVLLAGKDVVILQNLLRRSWNVTTEIDATGVYDKQTAKAVGEYKKANLITR